MKTAINLLPAAYQRQLMLRRRLGQWGAVLSLCLMIGGLVRWHDQREHQSLVQQLELISREQQPTQLMLQQLVNMRRELSELQQLETTAQELEYQRPALSLLGILSEIGESTAGRLRITKLDLKGLQRFDAVEISRAAGKPATGVELSGVSLDNQAIAKLESGLWESGFFEHVELVKSTEMGDENSALREYLVRCEL